MIPELPTEVDGRPTYFDYPVTKHPATMRLRSSERQLREVVDSFPMGDPLTANSTAALVYTLDQLRRFEQGEYEHRIRLLRAELGRCRDSQPE